MNIPIFRANIENSNKYITGNLRKILTADSDVIMIEGLENLARIGINQGLYKIDETTLAIHFPDMLDSEGNKIFASLSEDGKGGDIIEWTIFPSDTQQQRIKGTPYYSGHSVFQITNRIEMMWHSLVPHRKSKVIGIQE